MTECFTFTAEFKVEHFTSSKALFCWLCTITIGNESITGLGTDRQSCISQALRTLSTYTWKEPRDEQHQPHIHSNDPDYQV